jgi:anti-sigma factor RsiW
MAEFLADYLDGSLDAEVRRRFERHLAECPDCVAYLRSYATTIALARGSHAEDPVPDVPDELVRAILTVRRGRT